MFVPKLRLAIARATRLRGAANVLAFTGLATACTIREPILGSNPEQDENLGTEIAGSQGVGLRSSLFWSADDTLLFFEVGNGPVLLRAANPETGATVTLDGPRDDYVDPIRSATGELIYFSVRGQNNRRTTYLRPGGGESPIMLTNRAPGTDVEQASDGRLVLPAPAGDVVAYIVYPDSLFLYEVATGGRRFISDRCIRAIAFSPDQATLMCRRDAGGDAGYGTVALETGEAGELTLLPLEFAMLQIIRWDDDAIRTLYRANSRFRIRNIDAGTTLTLWQPGQGVGLRVVDFYNFSWSGDGTRFAFWSHECLRLNRVGNCEYGQSLMHVVDLAENQGRTVVVAKGTRGGEQVALSRDGTRVAYVFNERVWIQVVD